MIYRQQLFFFINISTFINDQQWTSQQAPHIRSTRSEHVVWVFHVKMFVQWTNLSFLKSIAKIQLNCSFFLWIFVFKKDMDLFISGLHQTLVYKLPHAAVPCVMNSSIDMLDTDSFTDLIICSYMPEAVVYHVDERLQSTRWHSRILGTLSYLLKE